MAVLQADDVEYELNNVTLTWNSRAAVCPRTSVAPRVPAVATSERNASGAGGRISPLMPGIDVPRKVIAMINWIDRVTGFVAEAVRAVCLLAAPVSVLAITSAPTVPLISIGLFALLLLSQIAINGLRSQPQR